MDNAIRFSIRWTEIYPLDSVIRPLMQLGPSDKKRAKCNIKCRIGNLITGESNFDEQSKSGSLISLDGEFYTKYTC